MSAASSARAAGPATRVPGWARLVARCAALLDRLPGGRRLVTELSRIELVDRSLALGAQALLALLPFLVVLAAFAPHALGSAVVGQVRDAMGMSATEVRPITSLVAGGASVDANAGVSGLLVALVSATSFSRALGRMYVRVFEMHGQQGRGRVFRSVVWLPGWLGYVAVLGLLARWPRGAFGDPGLPLVLSVVVQLAFWWWSVHYLLLGRVAWSQLLPAALVTTAGAMALVGCSPLVMPSYTRSNVAHFGSFGLVLAAATWLVAFGGMLVASNLVGRLLAEHDGWRRLVALVRDRTASRGAHR